MFQRGLFVSVAIIGGDLFGDWEGALNVGLLPIGTVAYWLLGAQKTAQAAEFGRETHLPGPADSLHIAACLCKPRSEPQAEMRQHEPD